MTYPEMLKAEAEFKKAIEKQPKGPRGATRAQLEYRKGFLGKFIACVECGKHLGGHTVSELQDCSNARS